MARSADVRFSPEPHSVAKELATAAPVCRAEASSFPFSGDELARAAAGSTEMGHSRIVSLDVSAPVYPAQ
ncbi:MAG: hypothetical protein JRF15_06050 [Deltaproteobacteria bacterium]|nr:hypothetical protein [Deltaproteobacteria bacterium]